MSANNIQLPDIKEKLEAMRRNSDQLMNAATQKAVVPYVSTNPRIPPVTTAVLHQQQTHSTCAAGLFSFLSVLVFMGTVLVILYYGFSLDNNPDANLEFKEQKIRTEIEILTGSDRYKSYEYSSCLKKEIHATAESKGKDFYDYPLIPLESWIPDVVRIRSELERGDLSSFPEIQKMIKQKQSFMVEATPIRLPQPILDASQENALALVPLPAKVGFDLTEHVSLDSLLVERDKAKTKELAVKEKYHCYYLSVVRAEGCYGEYADKARTGIIARWTKWESDKNMSRFMKLYASIHSLEYEFWGKIAALSIIPSIAVIGIIILILRGKNSGRSCSPSCCHRRNKTE